MNGNITSLLRNRANDADGVSQDKLAYSYNHLAGSGDLQSNRLYHVRDEVNRHSGDYYGKQAVNTASIESANYFTYDEIGNIKENRADGYKIEWTAARKIKEIIRLSDTNSGPNLEFKYDAFGRRICKIVKPRSNGGTSQNPHFVEAVSQDWEYEYYALDASGNILATYEHKMTTSTCVSTEKSTAVLVFNPIVFNGPNGAPSITVFLATPQGTEPYSMSANSGEFRNQLVANINANSASDFTAALAPDICYDCVRLTAKQAGTAINATAISATGNYASLITVLKPVSGSEANVCYTVTSSKLKEQLIYADSRLGVLNKNKVLTGNAPAATSIYTNVLGRRSYEIVNWLGSVISTVSDVKLWRTIAKDSIVIASAYESGDESLFFGGGGDYHTTTKEAASGTRSLVLEPQPGMFYGHFGPNVREYIKPGNIVNIDVKTMWFGDSITERGGSIAYVIVDGQGNKTYDINGNEQWREITLSRATGDLPSDSTAPNSIKWHNNGVTNWVIPQVYDAGGVLYTQDDLTIHIVPWVANGCNKTYFDDLRVRINKSNETESYFTPIVQSSSDFSDFGNAIREYTSTSYRFGFDGMEKDDEISGNNNSYNTSYRQNDTRLGRWFSVDPIMNPSMSPYTSMDNDPINLNDPLGLKTGADGEIKVGKNKFNRTKLSGKKLEEAKKHKMEDSDIGGDGVNRKAHKNKDGSYYAKDDEGNYYLLTPAKEKSQQTNSSSSEKKNDATQQTQHKEEDKATQEKKEQVKQADANKSTSSLAEDFAYATPVWGTCQRSTDAFYRGDILEGIGWYGMAFAEAISFGTLYEARVASSTTVAVTTKVATTTTTQVVKQQASTVMKVETAATIETAVRGTSLTRLLTSMGTNTKAAAAFFGWGNRTALTKSVSDFTKEELLANGWTKEKLLELARAYEDQIQKAIGAGTSNPAAQVRKQQALDLVKYFFGN